MAIDNELLQAIEKALPAIQVNTLTSALNDYEKVKADNEVLATQLKSQTEEADRNLEKVRELDALVAKLEDELAKVAADRDAVTAEARDAELAGLRATVEAINATTDKFLKNTIYRETLQHHVLNEYPNIQTQYTPGGGSSPVQVGVHKQHEPVTDVKEAAFE